jgi:hypothetical protein
MRLLLRMVPLDAESVLALTARAWGAGEMSVPFKRALALAVAVAFDERPGAQAESAVGPSDGGSTEVKRGT